MNDSIASQIMLIRSVAQHLNDVGNNLFELDDVTALGKLRPFARIVAQFLADYDTEQRAGYRDLRGIQGQTTRMRRAQKAIHDKVHGFNPQGLEKFIEEEIAETNVQAKKVVDKLESTIQQVVISELKRHFGEEDQAWWISGVPKAVRIAASKLQEEDDNRRGGSHFYLNLVDYRKIVSDNWVLFESLFGFGSKNTSKEKRTSWLVELNDVRKIVSHASSGRTVSLEQLAQIQSFHDEFLSRIENPE